MLSLRVWHTYIGIFIAPSVLFFALTGALQLFNLHEAHEGYQPAALVEKLSSVHKDQVFALKEQDEHPDAAAQPPTAPEEHEAEPKLGTLVLKWFFLAVALALSASTLLGLWIGLSLSHRRPYRLDAADFRGSGAARAHRALTKGLWAQERGVALRSGQRRPYAERRRRIADIADPAHGAGAVE